MADKSRAMNETFVVYYIKKDNTYRAYADITTSKELKAHLNNGDANVVHICKDTAEAEIIANNLNESYKLDGVLFTEQNSRKS